jgi:hypothetical protein
MNTLRNGSTAERIRRRVIRSRDRFWRVEDFDGDPKAIEMAVLRLERAGELERVRRGVYWRGRNTRYGRAVPSHLEAVREVIGDGEGVGAAGWYATNLLGLSTQVAPRPLLAVSRRVPKGLGNIDFVNRASRTGRRDAALNDREITFLEALEGWDRFVELDTPTAVKRMVGLLDRKDIRVARLVRAASTESSRVRERLRYLLAQAGKVDEADRVERARSRAGRESALSVFRSAS